jgi:hypothetical protein
MEDRRGTPVFVVSRILRKVVIGRVAHDDPTFLMIFWDFDGETNRGFENVRTDILCEHIKDFWDGKTITIHGEKFPSFFGLNRHDVVSTALRWYSEWASAALTEVSHRLLLASRLQNP